MTKYYQFLPPVHGGKGDSLYFGMYPGGLGGSALFHIWSYPYELRTIGPDMKPHNRINCRACVTLRSAGEKLCTNCPIKSGPSGLSIGTIVQINWGAKCWISQFPLGWKRIIGIRQRNILLAFYSIHIHSRTMGEKDDIMENRLFQNLDVLVGFLADAILPYLRRRKSWNLSPQDGTQTSISNTCRWDIEKYATCVV